MIHTRLFAEPFAAPSPKMHGRIEELLYLYAVVIIISGVSYGIISNKY